MGRYVERSEHAARLLDVTQRVVIDQAEVDRAAAEGQWSNTLTVLGLPDGLALEPAVLDDQIAGSVASSLSRARENARQVREVISSEMWDYLNQAYWALEEASQSKRKREILSDTLDAVMKASFLWGGVADATMGRGTGWLFIRLGQFVERAERTSRIVRSQWRVIEARHPRGAGDSAENVAWLTLLRSCGSLEEFRKRYATRMEPRTIADFLVLDRLYPRTIRYSVSVASEFARRLGEDVQERGRVTARAFGKVAAKLDYIDLDEVMDRGPADFLDEVSDELATATLRLQEAYFLH
jgi:uncharacterized alpha-E superfamily protein